MKCLENDYGYDVNRSTTRIPQANAIVEPVHQTIGNMIRTLFANDPDLDEADPTSVCLPRLRSQREQQSTLRLMLRRVNWYLAETRC